MEKELQEKAVAILDSIANTVGQAKDFALEQLPDVAYQYILFYRCYNTFTVIASFLILAYCFKILKNIDYESEEISSVIRFSISSVGFLIVSIVLLCEIKEFIMVWVAPKVFLITEITKLVK